MRRTPRREPKEDGEVGETAQDVLDRHLHQTPGLRQTIRRLKKNEVELTPASASAAGRLLSAALSPEPWKADKEDAKEALDIMATVMLPRRKSEREAAAGAAEAACGRGSSGGHPPRAGGQKYGARRCVGGEEAEGGLACRTEAPEAHQPRVHGARVRERRGERRRGECV